MATTVIAERDTHPYVDWAAIIAGAVLATAIAFLMLAFGAAIGLSFASPYKTPTEGSMWLFAVGAGLWLMWVQGSAYMAGGYLTGRLRHRHGDATPNEVEVRDGAHGLIVWGLGTLIAALVTAFIGTGAIQLAGGAAQTAATAASGNADQTSYLVDTLFRPATPTPAAAGSTAPGMAPATTPSATAGMSSTPSPDANRAAENNRREVTGILTVSGVRGDVSADDRTYIARLVAERTGLSQAEAQRRVDATLADAKAKADKARKAAVVSAFITITALLIGAAAAWWAASMGGRDRDAGTLFTLFGRWGYRR
jgi:hypothetical protein